jgi:hypothetical protein
MRSVGGPSNSVAWTWTWTTTMRKKSRSRRTKDAAEGTSHAEPLMHVIESKTREKKSSDLLPLRDQVHTRAGYPEERFKH